MKRFMTDFKGVPSLTSSVKVMKRSLCHLEVKN